MTRPLLELGTPESVREVVGQRLARLDSATIELLELAAEAGPEFELEPVRRAAGIAEPELLARPRARRSASGMIEELPSQRPGLPLHPRARAPRASTTGSRGCAGPSSTSGRRGARGCRGDAPAGRSPTSPTTSAPRRRSAGPSGRSSTTCGRPRAASAALAFDEARERLRTAIALGIDDAARARRGLLELGTAQPPGRQGAPTRWTPSPRRRRSPASWATPSCSRGPRSATRRPAGVPGWSTRSAVELLEEALAALGEGSPELRVGLLAGLARALDFQGERERGAIVRESAIELARRRGDRAGLAKVLVRSYWSRGTTPLEEILAMLTEARRSARSSATSRSSAEAMGWRVPTFVALGDLDLRPGARSPPCG